MFNAVSTDILNIQNVDGLILYDDLDLSFNLVDKTSVWTTNTIDILSFIASEASALTVYKKEERTNNDIIDANALNTKAGNSNTYLKTDIDNQFITIETYNYYISLYALLSNVYTKVNTDILYNTKADQNTSDLKTEIDETFTTLDNYNTSISLYALLSNGYTKMSTDTILNNKAEKLNTYLKVDVNNKFITIDTYKYNLSLCAWLSNGYVKVDTDALLTNKLNNNTGSLSMSIKLILVLM